MRQKKRLLLYTDSQRKGARPITGRTLPKSGSKKSKAKGWEEGKQAARGKGFPPKGKGFPLLAKKKEEREGRPRKGAKKMNKKIYIVFYPNFINDDTDEYKLAKKLSNLGKKQAILKKKLNSIQVDNVV